MPRLSTVVSCVLAVWGVLLLCTSAKRGYFPQSTEKRSWIEARRHCQTCFTELVTLTPENFQHFARNLSSEHWIGLRKRPLSPFDNSTLYPFNDNTTFWSRWANGDPLSFQNWYPGYPVFKSPYPRKECCSCSCTCPAQPTAPPTTPASVTTNSPLKLSLESECMKSPMLFQGPDPDENYIEDPCVAMLSFGAWVEKECSERLHFICYEDRFPGKVNVMDIKSTSAKISWNQVPGDITHYRVEVNNTSVPKQNHSQETYSLSDLEPGTLYLVQVFPVKCGRDLDPEEGLFYTVPNTVTGLGLVDRTERCVSLRWTRPDGNVDMYFIKTSSTEREINCVTEHTAICDLTPGSPHTFSVYAGVKDQSQRSEESTFVAYTKPAKVSNLKAGAVTSNSLTLSWDTPPGSATGYRVITSWNEKSELQERKNEFEGNRFDVKNLPSGTKITLNVSALANYTLEGESLSVVCFTKPEPITNLFLESTDDTITAEWNSTKGSPVFAAQLWLGDVMKDICRNITDNKVTFSSLFSAANYTVKVYSVTENGNSSEVSKSIFTSPTAPRNAEVSKTSQNSLTFTWMPPPNTDTVQYLVRLYSSFWGQKWEKDLNNETTYTFNNLTSGTNYSFEVYTVAHDKLSNPEALRAATDSNEREITLSVVCSSSEPLWCDKNETKTSAFQKLHSHFQDLLADHVVWRLDPAGP